ncbi:septum site-determining protein Ssd [Nakamurella alba]|nr:septum site-determining protein Ssd [Nakamurella alba]
MSGLPLLITEDELVLDELLRVAAAAQVEVLHSRLPVSRQAWRTAPVVLLDAAVADRLLASAPTRRDGVLAVTGPGRGSGPPVDWPSLLALGVSAVHDLDVDDAALVGALTEAAAPGPEGGRVVAVTGAAGGVGTSVFAAALALVAAGRGRQVVLGDGDPWGAGLDLLLGVEEQEGARWEALHAPTGSLGAQALHRSLPGIPVARGRVSVLGHDRTAPVPAPSATVEVVVRSVRRAGDLFVADLPGHPEPASDLVIGVADLVVLVTTSDVRGGFAAERAVERIRALGAEPGLVVRGPAPGGVGPEEIAAALGVELLAGYRPEPGLARDLEHGRPPGHRGRGPLAVAAARVLDRVA